MLDGGGQRTFGNAAFRSCLCAGDELLVHLVERRGLAFDSAFVPASLDPVRDIAIVWLVLEGSSAVSPASEAPAWRPAPFAHALDEVDFTGADGGRTTRLRTRGSAFLSVDVRFRGRHRGPRWARGPADVRDVLAAARDLTDVLHAQRFERPLSEAIEPLLESLVRAGVAAPSLTRAHHTVASPMARAVWQIARRALGSLDTGATLKLFHPLGLSDRHLERVIGRFFEDVLLPATSWRSLVRQKRLGLAALLLSNPDLTVRKIAELVGYGGPEALANAFQRAGLPSPAAIRAATSEPGDDALAGSLREEPSGRLVDSDQLSRVELDDT